MSGSHEFLRSVALRSLTLALAGLVVLGAPSASAADDTTDCLRLTGSVGDRCLRRYSKALAADRDTAPILQETVFTLGDNCTEPAAVDLGYLDVLDVRKQVPEACELFAEDFHAVVTVSEAGLTADQLKCRKKAIRQASKVRTQISKTYGKRCILRRYQGKGCDSVKRDAAVESIAAKAATRIVQACGNDFDAVYTYTGDSVFPRIQQHVQVLVDRAKHYAQRIYHSNDYDPTALYGPFPIGLTTIELFDTSRLDVAGTGPRPVTVEVYYPSTAAAVAGEPLEDVEILGITVATVPAFRDVDLAAGDRPLVVFSHGNNGVRIQSFFFAGHLASHGYIVVSPDHHGNTFIDTLAGVIDPTPELNRPQDMSFVIDEMLAADLAPGDFFEGAIDEMRIGASGHSFGGLTALLLAGGDSGIGPFTDPRVSAIFPQAPAAPFPDAFFSTITIPTLIVGGTIDETTPFDTQQQRPFDLLPSGASIVGLAEVANAGHFSFSDFCEVPPTILGFLGGAEEACETRHLPWRYAQDVTKYLSLNFFDATLRDDALALDRLSPATMATLDDVRYQSK